ncbi:ccr4-associated factor, putative [Ricinus communis]|uniref:Ccr4-associated factor, putative n=1 Tax=Ricinus communis TaxID=3988 RepID=B9S4V8_RICCO|nr:ccr4-associated factor, putative [Ricinus communis]
MVREGYLEELRKIDQSRYSFQHDSIEFLKNSEIDFGRLNRHYILRKHQVLQLIVDIKHMVSLCEGLFNGEFGMQKLAKVMEVERVGMAHQAGSDSLLTSQLFAKIKDTFQVEESSIWTIYMVFIQRMQITAATNSYSSQSTLAQDDIPFIHCHHRLFPICT